MRARVLVLGCSGTSTGELSLVFDLLRRLEREVELHASVSELSARASGWHGARVHAWPAAGGPAAVAAIEAAIARVDPEVLIVADALLAYATSPELARFFRRGPNLLAPLIAREAARRRVLMLDLYDWDANAEKVDVFGRPAARSMAEIPAGVGRLMPSPYLAPAPSTPGRGRYAMMADAPPRRARRAERRVLFVSSPWQHLLAEHPEARATTHAVLERLFALLDAAGARELVHLGPAPIPALGRTPYRHVPELPPAEFRALLESVDLVFGANAIATTNIRAASLRVPAAALWLDERGPGRYPSAVWPLGLHALIGAVLEDNPFAELVLRIDGDAPDAADRLAAALDDPASIRRRQSRYFRRLAAMDSPEVAFTRALEG